MSEKETFAETLARFRRLEEDALEREKKRPQQSSASSSAPKLSVAKASALKALRSRRFDPNVRWYKATEKRVPRPFPVPVLLALCA